MYSGVDTYRYSAVTCAPFKIINRIDIAKCRNEAVKSLLDIKSRLCNISCSMYKAESEIMAMNNM
jgi:hypothetical protein